MQIFGKTAIESANKKVNVILLDPPIFHLNNEQQEVQHYKYSPVYKPNTDYVPPKSIPFTLHVYNIPRNITKRKFIEIVKSKIQTIIYGCNFGNDKEKKLGVAYLRFKDEEESGRKALKILDGKQIDNLFIGANVAKKQY